MNEWTREDLPADYKLWDDLQGQYPGLRILSSFPMGTLLDAVVEHLNAHHPKPDGDLHSTVLRQAGHVHDLIADLADMERERDEWKARAEAAEARTAITREDVEKAIDGIVPVWDSEVEKIVVALHEMVAGDDPAVFVVRESDVASVSVVKHDVNEWEADGKYAPHADVAAARKGAAEWIAMATRCEAVARAIEAGQATDPVEELAGQIESATREAIRQVCDDLADVVPSLDPMAVERAMEVTAASRKVAAHVLGQEAGDE